MTASPPSASGAAEFDLVDKLAIQELTHRYAYHLDRYELEPLLALWTEDATFDERPVGLGFFDGIGEIRRFFEHDFTISTAHVHLVTNHLLEPVSATEATGSCYCLVEADLRTGAVVHVAVCYTDSYAKRGGHWLFRSRVVTQFCKADVSAVADAVRRAGDH